MIIVSTLRQCVDITKEKKLTENVDYESVFRIVDRMKMGRRCCSLGGREMRY